MISLLSNYIVSFQLPSSFQMHWVVVYCEEACLYPICLTVLLSPCLSVCLICYLPTFLSSIWPILIIINYPFIICLFMPIIYPSSIYLLSTHLSINLSITYYLLVTCLSIIHLYLSTHYSAFHYLFTIFLFISYCLLSTCQSSSRSIIYLLSITCQSANQSIHQSSIRNSCGFLL